MSSNSGPKLVDPSTRSNPLSIKVTHFDLHLAVDFSAKVLRGDVEITAKSVSPDEPATRLVLDVNHLNINKVVGLATNRDIEFTIADGGAVGNSLTVPLAEEDIGTDGEVRIRIHYNTTPESSAVQWLDAAATKDQTAPFLFTQCQAIHARTLLPCQDTPMVKASYTAAIRCPQGTIAIMSALGNGDEPTEKHADGSQTFSFTQPIAMASYLVALAVGNLASKQVGPRSFVWAEPSVVDAAAYEFADTEEFLATGESICGPYVWTRYDVLCMPPSFPYGGMENPCLTFVTPTLLAGDRSLADVVIHEITHSWTGNLVTNRTWEHFWLNEGWTMFVQRKIARDLYGQPVADLDAIEGLSDLKASIDRYGNDHNFTALVPDLSADGGCDPDDAFSTVPYEKGHALLCTIQHAVGGPKIMDPFIKAYVAKFGHPTMTLTSDNFKDFCVEYFQSNHQIDLEKKVDWQKWFFSPGMPEGMRELFDDSLMQAVVALIDVWVTAPTPASIGGHQVTYEVNLSISPEAEGDYVAWLGPHMREMLTVPGFLSANLASVPDFKSAEATEVGWKGYVASYNVESAAAMKAYFDEHAAKMRGNNPFEGKFRAWRRVLHHARRPAATDLDGWTCSQKTLFLKTFLDDHVGGLSTAMVNHMDRLYNLSAQRNAEIRFNWQRICIAVGKADIIPHVVTFLKEQGRMKFVRPLYRALLQASVKHPDQKAAFYDAAVNTFGEAATSYHPIASKMIARDIEQHNEEQTKP